MTRGPQWSSEQSHSFCTGQSVQSGL